MTKTSASNKKSSGTTAKTSRPRAQPSTSGKATKKTGATPPPPVVTASADEPQDAPRPLTEEQKNLDLLTRIDLALGIEASAVFSKRGLIAARNFTVSRQHCSHLLDWLERRLPASVKAVEVKLGPLTTQLDEPPDASGGPVPIYGSDMYTLVFYPRGSLWFMAAYNYERDVPYMDFQKWQKDLLAFLDEAGL